MKKSEKCIRSIKGCKVRTKTPTGDSAQLRAYIFPNGEVKVQQFIFTEPEYEVHVSDLCIRATSNYKLITRQLLLTNKTATHLANILSELIYFHKKQHEKKKD